MTWTRRRASGSGIRAAIRGHDGAHISGRRPDPCSVYPLWVSPRPSRLTAGNARGSMGIRDILGKPSDGSSLKEPGRAGGVWCEGRPSSRPRTKFLKRCTTPSVLAGTMVAVAGAVAFAASFNAADPGARRIASGLGRCSAGGRRSRRRGVPVDSCRGDGRDDASGAPWATRAAPYPMGGGALGVGPGEPRVVGICAGAGHAARVARVYHARRAARRGALCREQLALLAGGPVGGGAPPAARHAEQTSGSGVPGWMGDCLGGGRALEGETVSL